MGTKRTTGSNKSFTIWADNWEEASFAADVLDATQDAHGAGNNAFRVMIIPDQETPFDTCYLTDAATEEITRRFVVV